jgi:hypothetical protein
MEIIRLMREMITKERQHSSRLYDKNMKLMRACETHGLDVGRILS